MTPVALKAILRRSMSKEGIPLTETSMSNKKNLTLTDDDLEAVGSAVVEALLEVIRAEMARLVWDGIRKVVIAGAAGLWAWSQVTHLIK